MRYENIVGLKCEYSLHVKFKSFYFISENL